MSTLPTLVKADVRTRQRSLPPIALAGSLALFAGIPAHGQVLLNGDFNEGTSGWGCSPSVTTQLLLGGPLQPNNVALLSGGLLSFTTADDNRLCQSITGLIPGQAYVLSFQATRPGTALTPTCSGRIRVIGAGVDQTVTRTGSFNLTWEFIPFVATATNHTLQIDPGTQALIGLALDNIGVSLDTPLPVDLLHFTAVPRGRDVELTWATLNESDNAGFSILRSNDMHEWTLLGTWDGQGHTSGHTGYAVLDTGLSIGTCYYRLLQTDLNGAIVDKAFCSVSVIGDERRLVWPNPVSAIAHFDDPGHPGMVRIVDVSGREHRVPMDRKAGVSTFDASALPSGIYHLVLGNGLVTAAFVRE